MEEYFFSVSHYCGDKQEGEHLVQVPMRMGPETLPRELEACLRVAGEGTFLSYRVLPATEVLIYLMTEKLRAYASVYPEAARTAGEKMIQLLEETESDDDMFPESEIERIREIIGGY